MSKINAKAEVENQNDDKKFVIKKIAKSTVRLKFDSKTEEK